MLIGTWLSRASPWRVAVTMMSWVSVSAVVLAGAAFCAGAGMANAASVVPARSRLARFGAIIPMAHLPLIIGRPLRAGLARDPVREEGGRHLSGARLLLQNTGLFGRLRTLSLNCTFLMLLKERGRRLMSIAKLGHWHTL